jgi:hypothetical protein
MLEGASTLDVASMAELASAPDATSDVEQEAGTAASESATSRRTTVRRRFSSRASIPNASVFRPKRFAVQHIARNIQGFAGRALRSMERR